MYLLRQRGQCGLPVPSTERAQDSQANLDSQLSALLANRRVSGLGGRVVAKAQTGDCLQLRQARLVQPTDCNRHWGAWALTLIFERHHSP